MRTIAEIFKDNQELLENPVIKELVISYKESIEIFRMHHEKMMNKNDKMELMLFESELCVVGGVKCKDVIQKMIDNI